MISMAQVVNGRYTARMDEPFVVFIIGMWLPLHEDPAAVGRRVIRARSAGTASRRPHRLIRLGSGAHAGHVGVRVGLARPRVH